MEDIYGIFTAHTHSNYDVTLSLSPEIVNEVEVHSTYYLEFEFTFTPPPAHCRIYVLFDFTPASRNSTVRRWEFIAAAVTAASINSTQ